MQFLRGLELFCVHETWYFWYVECLISTLFRIRCKFVLILKPNTEFITTTQIEIIIVSMLTILWLAIVLVYTVFLTHCLPETEVWLSRKIRLSQIQARVDLFALMNRFSEVFQYFICVIPLNLIPFYLFFIIKSLN